MQAIFGWPGNKLADWENHVCKHFPVVGELTIPWRWRNAGTEDFGRWQLEIRQKLKDGQPIDLTNAPTEASWVHLAGTDDHARQLRAAQTRAPSKKGTVLIVADSRRPPRQQRFASQIPGAVTVDAVDLRDMVQFADALDFRGPQALQKVAEFAGSVMTGVGASDLVR